MEEPSFELIKLPEPPKNLGTPPTMVEWKGEQRKLNDLCKEFKVKRETVMGRVKKGMSLEEALSKPSPMLIKKKPEPPKPAEKPEDISEKGIRTQIIKKLLDTFFADPERFEEWANDQMDQNYGTFFKTFIMPYLPKEPLTVADKGAQKAAIHIEYNAGGKKRPPVINIKGV